MDDEAAETRIPARGPRRGQAAAMSETAGGYERLRHFLDQLMSMSHVYQPVMIKTILAGGGAATRRQIAAAFLAADLSQLEYYEQIVKGYPTATLKRRGIVRHQRGVYRLDDGLSELTEWERASLMALCDAKLADYIARRQEAIWRHRAQNFDPVPGTLRYEVVRRAMGRCEACGVSNLERALQVDHIVPRSRDGSNHPDNLQALCSTCNAQKLDRDTTDFHAAHVAFTARAEGCEICAEPDSGEPLAFILRRPGAGTAVVARRHGSSYANLTQPEVNAVRRLEVAVLQELADGGSSRLRVVADLSSGAAHCTVRIEGTASS